MQFRQQASQASIACHSIRGYFLKCKLMNCHKKVGQHTSLWCSNACQNYAVRKGWYIISGFYIFVKNFVFSFFWSVCRNASFTESSWLKMLSITVLIITYLEIKEWQFFSKSFFDSRNLRIRNLLCKLTFYHDWTLPCYLIFGKSCNFSNLLLLCQMEVTIFAPYLKLGKGGVNKIRRRNLSTK